MSDKKAEFLQYIKEERARMEEIILEALVTYQKRTGLHIESVDVGTVEGKDGSQRFTSVTIKSVLP